MIQIKQSDGTLISMQSKLATIQQTKFHLVSAHNGSRYFEHHTSRDLNEIREDSAGMDFNLIIVENKGHYQSKQNLFRDRREFLFLHEAVTSRKDRFYFANDQLSLMDAYFKLPFRNTNPESDKLYFNLALMMPPYTQAKSIAQECAFNSDADELNPDDPISQSINDIIHSLKRQSSPLLTLGKLIYYFDKYLVDYPNFLSLIREELGNED